MKTDTIVALNGRVCCLLDLPCCIPPQGAQPGEAQLEALAHLIKEAFNGAGPDEPKFTRAAKAVLEHVDLVPKGAGSAIARAYAPYFKESAPTT